MKELIISKTSRSPVERVFGKHKDPINKLIEIGPLLKMFSQSPGEIRKQPFRGKRILILLHLLYDIIPFLEAMERLGLNPDDTIFFYKDYPYPEKQEIIDHLRIRGYSLRPRKQVNDDFLNELEAFEPKPLLIIEDGGYITPAVLTRPTLAAQVVGVVEQTTRGLWNIEAALEGKNATFPILPLAPSKLKSEFEPPFVADGIVNSIDKIFMERGLAYKTKNIGVIGCGAIGLATVKKLLPARVHVFDTNPEKLVVASLSGVVVTKTVEELAAKCQIIIGVSGKASINERVISALKNDVWLVSASSERYEIDMEYLYRRAESSEPIMYSPKFLAEEDSPTIGTAFTLAPTSNKVYVIGDGMPINFMGFGGMADQASDLIMSLILLAAIEVVTAHFPMGIVAKGIDDIQAKYDVAQQYLNLWIQ